jgi:hypothetical protein
MDAEGEVIAAIQREPGPPPDAYSALVANYEPTGETLQATARHRNRWVLLVR